MLKDEFCVIGGVLKGFKPNDSDNYDPTKIDIAIFKVDEALVLLILSAKIPAFMEYNYSVHGFNLLIINLLLY